MRILTYSALFVALLLVPFRPAPLAAATVDQILSSMTLEEKIGQMMLVAFKGPGVSPELAEMIAKRHIGGVILYSSWGNVENIRQVAALNAAIQAAAAATPRAVGLFVGIDQEGGPVIRLREGVTVFPSQMAVAATGNREHARAMARVMASELTVLGVNLNFSPVADVNSNPDNPIIGIRSFGSDPNVVSRLSAAMVEEYVRARMLCTPKHFPGHGDTDVDSHLGLPLSNHDKKTLDRIDFAPFRATFAAKAPAVMTAHVEVPALEPARDLPATLSSKILEGALRKELRFDGLIVTDSLGMGALSKGVGTVRAAVMAAKAGADVLLFGADIGHEPADQIAAFDNLVAAAKSGEIPMERIDRAVRRILTVKGEYGLLDARAIPNRALEIPFRVGIAENRQAALSAAQDSITLRHDRLRLLPLKPSDRVLIIWPERNSNDAVGSLPLAPGTALLRTAREPSSQDLRNAVEASAQVDKVVVFTYDATRNPAQQNLARTLLAIKPGGFVHVALGAPYDLSLFADAPTSVATYGDVPASIEALAKALAGRAPFTGRLPVRLQ
ncbi:glycoside hydrolase family 3 protein [Fundidesulfovibrio putealis]|uniref:glycoside hydrolase family 3 protein n=1 Tax=Fundidesulfovibrio putealis TaxID=270496 RepID=UPI000416E82A|nr:glycoside hydrolase family 3 protein [Fundidesulfovibrio putealis]